MLFVDDDRPDAKQAGRLTRAREKLAEAGIAIVSEGDIDAEAIDKQQLIDTHYGAIASRAVRLRLRVSTWPDWLFT